LARAKRRTSRSSSSAPRPVRTRAESSLDNFAPHADPAFGSRCEGSPPAVNVTVERQSFFEDAPELYELRGLRSHTHMFTASREGEYKIIYVADRYCVARPLKPPAAAPRPRTPTQQRY